MCSADTFRSLNALTVASALTSVGSHTTSTAAKVYLKDSASKVNQRKLALKIEMALCTVCPQAIFRNISENALKNTFSFAI